MIKVSNGGKPMSNNNKSLLEDLFNVVAETGKATAEVLKPYADKAVETVKNTYESAESEVNNQTAIYNIGKVVFDTLNECSMDELQPSDVDVESLAKLIKYIYVERYEEKIKQIQKEAE